MLELRRKLLPALAACGLMLALPADNVGTVFADAGGYATTPTWQPMDNRMTKERLTAWLESSRLLPGERDAILRRWGSLAESETLDVLDRFAICLAPVDERVAALVEHCSSSSAPFNPLEFTWLRDSTEPAFLRDNLRLYYARWLAEQQLYDEVLAWTDDIELDNVVDPSALLFYRVIAHHQLVQVEQAHVTLAQLLEREDALPQRFHKLALLMQKDLETVHDDSLDHIARRMSDIRRRLSLGRADQTVRQIEDGVIESLDKLIKELERQQQLAQARSSGGQPHGGQPSGNPMQDSRLADLKGPGKVDHRDVGNTAGWGDLPPRERERALQQIGREFPSHYQEVIEAYFRALANEDVPVVTEPQSAR